MSKRTVVLLVVAAGIWVAVLVYYFVFFKASPIRRANRVESAPRASEVSLNVTPEFLGKYEKIVEEKVEKPDLFSPYYTEKGKEYLRRFVVESGNVLSNPAFAGYIITKEGGRIFLKVGDRIKPVSVNDLIFDRYLIVYTSSVGVVVLDVEKGGLYVIK